MSVNRVSGPTSREGVLPPVDVRTAPQVAAAPGTAEGGHFRRVLAGLGGELDRGEKLVSRVSQGGHWSSGDLIALQAGIYRYSEAVDLSAKIVDRAGSAAKTVLQGSGGG